MKNTLPKKGLAKSTWSRFQGAAGHTHGCYGAGAGDDFTAWQDSQDLAICSMYPSNPLHQKWLLAIAFILVIPGCPSSSDWRTLAWRAVGINTWIPHMRHPNSRTSSSWRDLNACSSEETSDGHPSCTYRQILLRSGSFLVAFCTSVAVTGSAWSCPMLNIQDEHPSSGVVMLVGRGRQDNPSALLCWRVGLKMMS